MNKAQNALSLLIGESEAAACFAEIQRRTEPDDPDYLKGEIQRVTILKFLSKSNLTLFALSQKLEENPDIFESTHMLESIGDVTRTLKHHLINTIMRMMRSQ